MSVILSNRYFLGFVAIFVAGFIYYGYQSTEVDNDSTAASTTIQTTVETIPVSNADNAENVDATTVEGTETEGNEPAVDTTTENEVTQ